MYRVLVNIAEIHPDYAAEWEREHVNLNAELYHNHPEWYVGDMIPIMRDRKNKNKYVIVAIFASAEASKAAIKETMLIVQRSNKPYLADKINSRMFSFNLHPAHFWVKGGIATFGAISFHTLTPDVALYAGQMWNLAAADHHLVGLRAFDHKQPHKRMVFELFRDKSEFARHAAIVQELAGEANLNKLNSHATEGFFLEPLPATLMPSKL